MKVSMQHFITKFSHLKVHLSYYFYLCLKLCSYSYLQKWMCEHVSAPWWTFFEGSVVPAIDCAHLKATEVFSKEEDLCPSPSVPLVDVPFRYLCPIEKGPLTH